MNKVTGLTKIVKASNPNEDATQNQWFMNNKGKSLMKKPQQNPVGNVRDKSVNNNQEKYRNLTKSIKASNINENDYSEDEHWAGEEKKIQKEELQIKKLKFGPSTEDGGEEKTRRKKKNPVNIKSKDNADLNLANSRVKDPVNIIVNNNTYNLNFLGEKSSR